MQSVLQGRSTAFQWVLHGSIAAPAGTNSAQSKNPTDRVMMTNPTSGIEPPDSCRHVLYAVQLFTGGTLPYVQ
jgi:hypothetical protein